MFKFGFSAEEFSPEPNDNKIVWLESKEICASDNDLELGVKLTDDTIINRKYLHTCLKYIDPQRLIDEIVNSKQEHTGSALQAEKNNSDLIPGIYEGGLKVWECTHDLCNFIIDSKLELEGKHVLDLGCGAGLIGILCYKLGATCCLQDYNEDVLRQFTIPNSLLNEDSVKPVSMNCKYYSGDWLSFIECLDVSEDLNKFDFIFTSETIYNVENYDKLHQVFKSCLKKEGKIFLAAKYYYFGVGGGIPSFIEFLEKKRTFVNTKCWEHSNGVRREILEIKFNL